MRLLLLALFVCACAISSADAARITTRDGTVVMGEVQAFADGVYTVRTAFGIVKIPAASVTSIAMDPGPTPPPPGGGGALRLAGSTTIGDELMPDLIERYAASNGMPDGKWTSDGGDSSEQSFAAGSGDKSFSAHLSRHGSATAFSALADGKADIGMASRPINDAEIATLRGAGFGEANAPGQENVLALDGLAILVNRSNPVERLSIAQLSDIFTGATTDWQQLGGTPGPIHVIGRDAKSGTADTFKGIVLKTNKMTGAAELLDSSDAVSDRVAADPAAIGFAGFAYIRRAKALSVQTDCGIESPPSEYFVRTEEYPLSRRLFLYAKASAGDDNVHRFIGYALGQEGQAEAASKGFVDLQPRLSSPEYSTSRIQQALNQVAGTQSEPIDYKAIQLFNQVASGGRRLSVTFRFRSASFDLDTRSVRDVERVVAAVRAPELAQRSLVVVGFSDSQGASIRNVRLAQARAERIGKLLRAQGIAPKLVIGLGRIAPVACNSSPEGMQKNRRVEIWLGTPHS